MAQTENAPSLPPAEEQVQGAGEEWSLRLAQLEADRAQMQQEIKALRLLLERVIEHRQKSHGELVLLLTGLVSRLPLNDVGAVVSRLVEHHAQTNHFLGALSKGAADVELPEPSVLKTLDQTKKELASMIPPLVEELLKRDCPIEPELLRKVADDPESFFQPRMVRANRCYVKGQVPRERVVREFGEAALACFSDMTTDPKLNPHPKPEEIVLAFRGDFEAALGQAADLPADRRAALEALHARVQRSKADTPAARAQRALFQRLSFVVELLHYYEHQNTEPADVVFAQRLPVLIEQLALPAPGEPLTGELLEEAESLLSHIINPDHRQMVINNLGKVDAAGQTLRFVLRLRADKLPDLDQVFADCLRHLIPHRSEAPPAAEVAATLRLIHPEMRTLLLKTLLTCERLPRHEAEKLGRAVAAELGLSDLVATLQTEPAVPAEVERQIAWGRIKEMISRRNDAQTVATAIRDRLHSRYDAEEIRQSWITLIEADPISLIRIFSQIPYRADGQTDAIARPVMETYVSRLTHEKYASTLARVLTSLKNLHRAKADSPTLLNFLALVRWVDPEAAQRLSAAIGMAAPAPR